jgi:hypothetical protein
MKGRPPGIIIVALYAIVTGVGEIVVGVTGNFLGILSNNMKPSFSVAVVGAFYCLGGVASRITRQKWGAALSIAFIGAEILGRVYLVTAGIAPASGADLVKIFVGGAIACALMLYIWRRSFV